MERNSKGIIDFDSLTEEQQEAVTIFATCMGMSLRESMEGLTHVVDRFSAIALSAQKAAAVFSRIQYAAALAAWKEEDMGRLPGSTKTARGRAKRRKAVLEWYWKVHCRRQFGDA